MQWLFSLVILCAAAGLVADAAAGAERRPPPLTKLKLRRAPPEEGRRLVLEQLSDALIVRDESGEAGVTPVRPLDKVWLGMRASGTGTPGLCRSDDVIMTFVPVGPEKGASTPVRAAWLETLRNYRLLRNVHPQDAGSLDHDGRVAANADCAAVDVMKTHFIQFVPDYEVREAEAAFVEAIWQIRRVVSAAAGEGELPFELECLGELKGDEDQCRKELSGIDPDTTLSQANVCAPLEKNGVRHSCWTYSAWDSEGRPTLDVEIYGDRSGDVRDEMSETAALVRIRKSFVLIEQSID